MPLFDEFAKLIEKWEKTTALRGAFTSVEAQWAFDDGINHVLLSHILRTAERKGWSHHGFRVERGPSKARRLRRAWFVLAEGETIRQKTEPPPKEPAPALVDYHLPIVRWMLDRWKAAGEKPLTVKAAIAQCPTAHTSLQIGNALKAMRGRLVDGYRLIATATKAHNNVRQWDFRPEPPRTTPDPTCSTLSNKVNAPH